jgi:polysaccharide biosynthesis transport protein
VKTIAEIRARASADPRPGTLRRRDLEAFDRILERHGGGVLLVTGIGEGPLALSTGLAAAAVARGVRTALLECDLQAPALAGALGLERAPGLSEYLREAAEAGQILQPLVLAGPASAAAAGPLVCIVAGRAAGASLDSEGFRHALAKLRHAYDLIVVQGPSLAEQSGSLREAAAAADALLACVGPELASGRGGRRLSRALRRLSPSPAEVVVYR